MAIDASSHQGRPHGGPVITITITFSTAVSGLSLDAADIERGSVIESVEFRVYNVPTGGTPIHSVVVTGGDPGTGDGVRKNVVLSGFHRRRHHPPPRDPEAGRPRRHRRRVAIDNICFTEEPVPVEPATWGRIRTLFRDRRD